MSSKAVIIDYGSQVTQLIARRIRDAGVYSEIYHCSISAHEIKAMKPSVLVLSGGPASMNDTDAPQFDRALLEMGIPILAICYGMQAITQALGGELMYSQIREYGPSELTICKPSLLWDGLGVTSLVWMSHGDTVKIPPPGFMTIAHTNTLKVAAISDEARKIYAVQFHPEVHHSVDGERIIHNFLFKIAHLKPDWNVSSFVEHAISHIQEVVGKHHVVCALSGGVDSTVVAVLLHKALGKQVHCIFVDNGLLRSSEGEEIVTYLQEHFDLNLTFVQAQNFFLQMLHGVVDPEQKRKIIGHTFIDIFNENAYKIGDVHFLAQGTLYPDIIESVSHKGPSAVIKSHHNVGGLPEKMSMKLIEPLKELFKDEVRKVGIELGLPDFIVWRQPFPGPGLAIRIIGEVTKERLEILRKADSIVQAELKESGWYRKIWQGFAVLLPLKTVGVMGDSRTYEHVIALRCVDSVDAMTADWARLPSELLATLSKKIINEVQGVNRVVYDISSKPPSTIEWE